MPKTKTKVPTAPVPTTAGEPKKCACGCGQLTKGGVFRPGHDARHRSNLLKVIREGGDHEAIAKAKAELKVHGWSVPTS